MTDKRLQSSKFPSKGFLKKPVKWVKETFSRSQSRSTSPQPSTSGQENRDGEISSVQQAIVSSGSQDPVIGTSAALSQQGIFMYRCPIDEALIHFSSPYADHGASIQLSIQPNPEKPTSSTRSAVKDYATVALSFTTMLLKRLPDVVDPNPAKIAFGIAKVVLQIRDVRRCFFTPVLD